MAPARALLVGRIICATTTPRLRPTSRLFTASATPVRTARRISGLESGPVQQPHICRPCTRAYSQSASTTLQPPDFLNEAELHVFNKIRSELEPVKLEVQDISGGCGSMYAIAIVSPKFNGLTVIKQHKMVNQVLKDEIKNWHGLQLRTKAA